MRAGKDEGLDDSTTATLPPKTWCCRLADAITTTLPQHSTRKSPARPHMQPKAVSDRAALNQNLAYRREKAGRVGSENGRANKHARCTSARQGKRVCHALH